MALAASLSLLLLAGPAAADRGGEPSGSPAVPPGVRVYEFYARVTSYHNHPGDPVNGGPLNFMGRPLIAGRSAAGPALLAGSLVEVPDFNPLTSSGAVSSPLRRLLHRDGYDGFFILDDIGSAITFLSDGKPTSWKKEWRLSTLSRRSLENREAVLDIDIMVPDRVLSEAYENPLCLVRLYRADIGGINWTPSRSPVWWGGRKPYFDTLERFRSYMAILRGSLVVATTEP